MEETNKCSICSKDGAQHSTEVIPEKIIYVCDNCLEKAKINFIFICMNCGKSFLRPKALVIAKIKNPEMKRAYILCENDQIIQGIKMCISCNPIGVLDYMENQEIN